MKLTTTKARLWLAVVFVFNFSLAFCQSSSPKEMLVSVPFLTDKNAAIIQQSLSKTPGVEGMEACYSLHVIVIRYDSQKNTEESILGSLRDAEINSTVELLFSRDIQTIRRSYTLTTILDNFHRQQ